MHKVPFVKKKPRKRNKDGTWRKKRSDAGKKREKVNMSEEKARDTQFQNFANALYMECVTITQEEMLNNRIGANQCVIRHIARRAYDLAFHAIDNSRANNMEDWQTEQIMPYVPDMTELPKEQDA